MSTNEQDTHFQEFAKLLLKEMWPELLTLFSNEPANETDEIVQETVELIIARRAYDLMEHIMLYAPAAPVPDLTEWPEQEK